MRNLFFVAAALCGFGLSGAADAALIEVDAQTGVLTFKELTNPIGLTVRSASGKLIGANGVNIGDIYDSALAPTALAWSKFSGFGTGPLEAGAIVDVSGIAPGGVTAALGTDLLFEISPAFGAPIVTGALSVINDVAIPEPATLAMAGMGLIGMVGVARRRKA